MTPHEHTIDLITWSAISCTPDLKRKLRLLIYSCGKLPIISVLEGEYERCMNRINGDMGTSRMSIWTDILSNAIRVAENG
jgi:hypothetical protein